MADLEPRVLLDAAALVTAVAAAAEAEAAENEAAENTAEAEAGSDDDSLRVTLGGTATVDGVATLMAAVAYEDMSDEAPSTEARTVNFVLRNGPPFDDGDPLSLPPGVAKFDLGVDIIAAEEDSQDIIPPPLPVEPTGPVSGPPPVEPPDGPGRRAGDAVRRPPAIERQLHGRQRFSQQLWIG